MGTSGPEIKGRQFDAKVNTLLFPAPDSSYDLDTFPEEAWYHLLSSATLTKL